jgi:plasmid stabilization system protein ParE
MKYQVEITAQAQSDMADEFLWLYERSPQAAVRWHERVDEAIRSLASLPELFPLVPESGALNAAIRHRIVGEYRIIFLVVERRSVRVLRCGMVIADR